LKEKVELIRESVCVCNTYLRHWTFSDTTTVWHFGYYMMQMWQCTVTNQVHRS